MYRKKILFPVLSVVALLAVAGSGYAGVALAMSHLAGPAPSVMSYQGYLTDSLGMPITGTPDFDFRIWDAASAGNQVWTEIQNNVPVANGYFSVMLGSVSPLAAAHFTGPRYLEVRVDTGGGYTTLPRQLLGAVPFAYQAEQADLANQASTALSVPWSGITSRPVGLDDGDNDTLIGLSPCANGQVPKYNGGVWSCQNDMDTNTTYTAGDGLTLVGTQFSAMGTPYDHVVIVAKVGGDYTSIQTALDNISANLNSRYLVWIGPGTYSERVVMEPYVDLMGAGENVTIITMPGASAPGTATVKGASMAMLSLLTVKAVGGDYATAMYNLDADPVLRHVALSAEEGLIETAGMRNHGSVSTSRSQPDLKDVSVTAYRTYGATGNVYGLYNAEESYVKLQNVSITTYYGGANYGIFNSADSVINMIDSKVRVLSGDNAYGIQTGSRISIVDHVNVYVTGTSSVTGINSNSQDMVIRNLYLEVSGENNLTGIFTTARQEWYDSVVKVSTGNDAATTFGIFNVAGNLTLNRFDIQVNWGNATGISNLDSHLAVNRSRIVANSPFGSIGINHQGGLPMVVSVMNSLIEAATNTFFAPAPGPGMTFQIGGTYLAGGPVFPVPGMPGAPICAGVYDEFFVFIPGPNCP